MFREMRRKTKQISEEECLKLLQSEKRAVLAMNGDEGYPYCIPVNYLFEDGHIYIHGAMAGHKFDSLSKDQRICFTVSDQGTQGEGEWFYTVTSVVVFGRATLVQDRELTAQKTRNLGFKYYPTPEGVEEEMKAINRVQLIEIEIEHMTGKRVTEK